MKLNLESFLKELKEIQGNDGIFDITLEDIENYIKRYETDEVVLDVHAEHHEPLSRDVCSLEDVRFIFRVLEPIASEGERADWIFSSIKRAKPLRSRKF